tara:strand:+ start:2360 stop:2722 length:363 start_codon:yes stop_codon:yes gene_type:complete
MVETTYTTETVAKTIASTTASANATVVYTCPPLHDATIDILHLSNNNASTKKINVQFYHADTTDYHYILKLHAIAGNDSENIFGPSVVHLHAGDKIVAYGETANTIEALLSCKQFYNPSR